jgi:hypothetical protein
MEPIDISTPFPVPIMDNGSVPNELLGCFRQADVSRPGRMHLKHPLPSGPLTIYGNGRLILKA